MNTEKQKTDSEQNSANNEPVPDLPVVNQSQEVRSAMARMSPEPSERWVITELELVLKEQDQKQSAN